MCVCVYLPQSQRPEFHLYIFTKSVSVSPTSSTKFSSIKQKQMQQISFTTDLGQPTTTGRVDGKVGQSVRHMTAYCNRKLHKE